MVSLKGSCYGARHGIKALHGLWRLAWSLVALHGLLLLDMVFGAWHGLWLLGMVFGCSAWSRKLVPVAGHVSNFL